MRTLKEIVSFGENDCQIFVENVDDALEIGKTMVALSNSNGGSILIGLKKNGKIIGINPDDEIQKLTSISKSFCEPNIIFSSRVLQEGFRMTLEVSVLTSEIKPCKLIGISSINGVYIRKKNQNILANKILLNVWKYKERNEIKPIEFSKEELSVLDLIKNNPFISLTQIYKKSASPMIEIDYILVRFISWDVILMDINEDGKSMFSL